MELHLKKSGNNMVLMRDDQPLMCPIATRMLTPGRMANSLDVNQATCGSHCALFKLWHNDKADQWFAKLCHQEHTIDGKNVEKTSNNQPNTRSIFSI